MLFEIHEGLPLDGNVEIIEGCKGLFQYVPVGLQGFVAIHGGPIGASVHKSYDSWVAVKNRHGRKEDGLAVGTWVVVEKSEQRQDTPGVSS